MPQCKKCHKLFPNQLIIDGKRRNIHNRRYCIQCSPFRQNGSTTIMLLKSEGNKNKKKCSMCDRILKLNQFYKKKRGGHDSICIKCHKVYKRNYLKIRKIKAINYLGGKCIRCGYNKSISAMEFHHKNPSSKIDGIANIIHKKWNIVTQELNKCELLCSNCHRETHEIN